MVDCQFPGWGVHSCGENNCVRLSCTAGGYQSVIPKPTLNHEPTDFTLSMTYKDKTRAVCDDSFGPKEASVACMELYGAPGFVQFSVGHACRYENFWADDIFCEGTEIRYADCEHSPWGQHNCGPN